MIVFFSLLWQTAFAEGENADITILQPNFGYYGFVGLPYMPKSEYGYYRFGIHSAYVRDPLVYFKNNIDQGAVIGRRFINTIGGEFDFSDRFGAHLSIPIALQWNSEVPSLSRNGLGAGDMQAGIYGRLFERNGIQVGGRGSVYLPTSSNDAWLGETSPRLNLLANAMYEVDDFNLFAQTGMHVRPAINTNMDFVLGNEWLLDVGLSWNLWPEHTSLITSYHARHGTNNLFRGGAENSSEIVSAIQQVDGNEVWQFGISKGISDGYGASEFQAFVQYTIHHRPPPPTPEEIYVPPTIIEEPPMIEEIIEEESWEPEELAKVEDDQILIRDDIQFEVGTDIIVEASKPTVKAIADLINSDVRIGHVVIEGHASEEGSHEYNYDLSNLRARAIFKALVAQGVHPDRLSHRGYGEALPKTLGGTEEELAKNRRVEFHIVRQDSGDTVLSLRNLRSAPWAEIILEFIIPEPIKEELKSQYDDVEEDVFEQSDNPANSKSDPSKSPDNTQNDTANDNPANEGEAQ